MSDVSWLLLAADTVAQTADATGSAGLETEGSSGWFASLFTVPNLIALLALTTLEIVLGIDNIVFISILADRCEPKDRPRVRRIGLALAMVMRILLLFVISWVVALDEHALFTLMGQGVTVKDLVLLIGGLFLLAKAGYEIHHMVGVDSHDEAAKQIMSSAAKVIAQIVMMDLIFSIDSVITAVGMTDQLPVMITAVIIAVSMMMLFAKPVGDFVSRHPSMKMLALAFLILVGVLLIADGFDQHIPRGYVYFAMLFSFGVELLNMRVDAKRKKKRQQEAAAAPE